MSRNHRLSFMKVCTKLQNQSISGKCFIRSVMLLRFQELRKIKNSFVDHVICCALARTVKESLNSLLDLLKVLSTKTSESLCCWSEFEFDMWAYQWSKKEILFYS